MEDSATLGSDTSAIPGYKRQFMVGLPFLFTVNLCAGKDSSDHIGNTYIGITYITKEVHYGRLGYLFRLSDNCAIKI